MIFNYLTIEKMTDPQFQPGQTDPKTVQTQQWGGVFGGDPENIIQDPSMFWPLEDKEQNTEEKKPEEKKEDIGSNNPFDGYVIPQNNNVEEEKLEKNLEEKLEEKTEENENPIIDIPSVEPKSETNLPKEQNIEEKKPEEISEIEEITTENINRNSEDSIDKNERKEDNIINQKADEKEIKENNQEKKSDIQDKFSNLLDNVYELNELLNKKDGDLLEIIWSNNDKATVLYQFWINDQKEIHVKRIETDKENEETNFNEIKLWLNPESNLFEIFLDEVLLFEESDILEDNKKKSQVMEKLNKFIFLTESKLKDAQKEIRAKQEEEEERKRLQDIFRNF